MGKRVILGTRGVDVGMWVSAPGKLADSTVFDDLLIDTTRINTQPIFKGQVVNPRIYYDASRSSTGFWDGAAGVVPGWSSYYMNVLDHNLGYIPLCHVSIGSAWVGDTYPQVFLTTTSLYLWYKELKNRTATLVNGTYGPTWVLAEDTDRPLFIDFYMSMNYTLFRQRAV